MSAAPAPHQAPEFPPSAMPPPGQVLHAAPPCVRSTCDASCMPCLGGVLQHDTMTHGCRAELWCNQCQAWRLSSPVCTNFSCFGCAGLGCPAGPLQQEQAWWDAMHQPPTCLVCPLTPAAWGDSSRQLCLLVRRGIAYPQRQSCTPLPDQAAASACRSTIRSETGVAVVVGMHSAAVLPCHRGGKWPAACPGLPRLLADTSPHHCLQQQQTLGPAVSAAEVRLPAPRASPAPARVTEPISLARQASQVASPPPPQVASPPSPAGHAVEAAAAPAVHPSPQRRQRMRKVLRPGVAALLLAALAVLFLGVALVCVRWTVLPRSQAQPVDQKPRWMAPNLPGGLDAACRSAVQTTAQYCGRACSHPVVQVCSWLLEPRLAK